MAKTNEDRTPSIHIFEIEKREAFSGRRGTEYVVHARTENHRLSRFDIPFWRTGRNLKKMEADILAEYPRAVIRRQFHSRVLRSWSQKNNIRLYNEAYNAETKRRYGEMD